MNNANSGLSGDNEIADKLIGILLQYMPKHFNFILSTFVFQPQKDNPLMRLSFAEYHFTEIFIIRNQNAIICNCFLQDTLIV